MYFNIFFTPSKSNGNCSTNTNYYISVLCSTSYRLSHIKKLKPTVKGLKLMGEGSLSTFMGE